jgi:hypothetical protein
MMKIKPLALAVVTAGSLSVAGTAVAGNDTDARIAELERQIAELTALVGTQQQSDTMLEETVAANAAGVATNAADIEEARPMAKGTKFTYGGFIQLDAMATNYSDGKPGFYAGEDLLVPSTIPVEPVSGKSDSYSSFNMHAKSSRFFFTTATDTAAGKVSTRVELDFILTGDDNDERISNSWNPRLRHAFVKWDYSKNSSILAGQSWSTFFNVGALPDQIDFVGPVGTIFNRQPQIRWTMGGLQLAVENPATRLNGVDYDDSAEGIPDLIARYNGKAGGLNWSLAGMARELSYEDRTDAAIDGGSDEQFGYALSLAGKWMFGKDDLRFMLNYGDALGRYMGLNSYNDGYVDANGDIETIDQIGGFIAYRHYWSEKWRSSFTLSASEADNPDTNEYAGADSLAKAYQSFHANLNYLPTPKMAIGGELILANKEVEDGRDGDLSRLQFAVKYAF